MPTSDWPSVATEADNKQSFTFGATPFCQVLSFRKVFHPPTFQCSDNFWPNNVPSTELFHLPSMLFEDGRTVNIGRKAFEGKMVVPGFDGILLFCHINVL